MELPNPRFRARARLLAQLGEQLIKTESIALQELIKNSYDADATMCTVTISDIIDPNRAKIIIKDDGCGMDISTIRNVWLEIGTSYKSDQKQNTTTKRTPRFGRLPLGEKGIGRLGAHRLGREIEIVTRKEGFEECRLLIDWDAIGTTQYIEDLPVFLEERQAQIFQKGFGTEITIKRLNGEWSRGALRECARSINSLNSPFESSESFQVDFSVPGVDWLDGILTYKDFEQQSLYSFSVTMLGDSIVDFNYSFTPYPTMKLPGRTVSIEAVAKQCKLIQYDKESNQTKFLNLQSENVGQVKILGRIFDLDSRVLELAHTEKKGLKDYLALNGGVRIFRDGMRVWDYGEPGNDWLDLDSKRINTPTRKLGNKQIIASVFLNGEESAGLQEKTNREGFIDNNAYRVLKGACSFALERVELLRATDKELIRTYFSPKSKSEPVISALSVAKAAVNLHVKEKKARDEINRYLERIEEDYTRITDSLIKSAGAGLNLIVVIHQMQKILKNILAALRKKAMLEDIELQVKDLARLVEGYSILVRNSEKKRREIINLLDLSIFNVSFRIKSHDIVVEDLYKTHGSNIFGICTESHVVNAMMNLIDNSIWWMEYSKVADKSILIDISFELPGFVTVLVADTGPGFAISKELLGQPFTTAKPDGAGMGIGLHLTRQIMESLGGMLLFPSPSDFTIPIKFSEGAIVGLAFKKE